MTVWFTAHPAVAAIRHRVLVSLPSSPEPPDVTLVKDGRAQCALSSRPKSWPRANRRPQSSAAVPSATASPSASPPRTSSLLREDVGRQGRDPHRRPAARRPAHAHPYGSRAEKVFGHPPNPPLKQASATSSRNQRRRLLGESTSPPATVYELLDRLGCRWTSRDLGECLPTLQQSCSQRPTFPPPRRRSTGRLFADDAFQTPATVTAACNSPPGHALRLPDKEDRRTPRLGRRVQGQAVRRRA